MDWRKLQCKVIPQSGPVCKGCILFLHGLGNTADGLIQLLKKAWGEDISFPHIKMLFPTAPVRLYSRLGQVTTAWYDRHDLCLEGTEDPSVDEMCHVLTDLIQQEVHDGIPKERIIIGGYSMGGFMSLALAYKYNHNIAGVFTLSASFLTHDSEVFQVLKKIDDKANLPPLFQCHGNQDDVIDIELAKDTFNILTSLGVNGTFHTFDMGHEIIKQEISLLREFIMKQVPDV